MFDVQINERGQITTPNELRDIAKLTPQDTLKIQLDTSGRIVLYKKDIFDDLEDLTLSEAGASFVEYVESEAPSRMADSLPIALPFLVIIMSSCAANIKYSPKLSCNSVELTIMLQQNEPTTACELILHITRVGLLNL